MGAETKHAGRAPLGVRSWLARRLPPRVFVAAWLMLMVMGTVGVLVTWAVALTDLRGPRVITAVLVTLVSGVPLAVEWRHVGDVFDRAP